MVTQPQQTEDPSAARAPGAVLPPPEVPAGAPAYPPNAGYLPGPPAAPGPPPPGYYYAPPPEKAAVAPPPAYPPPVAGPPNSYPPAPQAPSRPSGLGVVLAIVIGAIALLIGLVILAVSWFVISRVSGTPVSTGPVHTETQSVALAGAEAADVTVTMGAGNVTLAGGAANLLDADFTYNVPAWKPEVSYTVNGASGTLTVSQPDTRGSPVGNTRYEWNLRLNNNVPLNLTANVGAGNTDLRLGSLNLSRLAVTSGAGNMTVDLTGTPRQNLDATITGGVGNTTVRLPADVGVRVVANGGLGKVTANGFTVSGDTYTNAVYGKTPMTLNITVKLGVGNMTLETVR